MTDVADGDMASNARQKLAWQRYQGDVVADIMVFRAKRAKPVVVPRCAW